MRATTALVVAFISSISAQSATAQSAARTHAKATAKRRTITTSAGTIAPVAAPVVTVAATATTTADSVKPADSPASSRRGLFGRAFSKAASVASNAATVVERTTGANQETAKTALLMAGKTANPGVLVLDQMLRMQREDHARAATTQAARESRINTATTRPPLTTQAPMATGMMSVTDDDSSSVAVQMECSRLAMHASSGDRTAADQLVRFQRELTAAIPAISAMSPSQQSTAYVSAMQSALVCVTRNQGCRAQ